ncbi:MAG: asparagine synthase (glutamine-hydrolyzing) [Candidatus Omnitrophota bacterium]|jgi:asparagine synthase (glutamine-hydrolysing)|nr:MAG: asparagine synthase (glutamine-hydrolyzing) [Candidatus Omnitrophota bacterium]
MCGIAGIFNFEPFSRVGDNFINRFSSSLHNRGPDDNGFFIDHNKGICFVHTRLSVIDLSSAGHQPMSSRDGKVKIVYNGEIYNYPELRRQLQSLGRDFLSNSDTEVIIQGYQEWGIEKLLHSLRGMFALAIFDSSSGRDKLILARDRFGIKPLYYYLNNNLILFSSTVDSIKNNGLVELEHERASRSTLLIFGHIPEPYTILKDVLALEAGSYLTISKEGPRLTKYYDLGKAVSESERLRDAAMVKKSLQKALEEAANIHLLSDVPLGIFLSGGIDSSALVAFSSLNRRGAISTVSLVFDEKEYSEGYYQKLVADKFNTIHNEYKITENGFYDEMDNIFKAMDQPSIDGINTFFVSLAAKNSGLKVVLSGAGADEVFCGYDYFGKVDTLKFLSRLSEVWHKPFSLFEGLENKFRKLSYLGERSGLSSYLSLRAILNFKEIIDILGVSRESLRNIIGRYSQDLPFGMSPNINWLSSMEINMYLKNQLLKDMDVMSMYHSIETRVPYLDHKLIEFVMSVDPGLKVDKLLPKPLLANLVKGLLPQELISRKKQGFVFPMNEWLKSQKGRDLFFDSARAVGIKNAFSLRLWNRFRKNNQLWAAIWAIIVIHRKAA